MCGICGIVLRDGVVTPALLKEMNATLLHRGPDDEGVFVAGEVGLAVRRLAIIDLVTGHQPIDNEDGTVTVVFNGEIYNYGELRATLAKRGHRLRTRTDTEVLVHLYEEQGVDFVRFLRGMFAIALWDQRRRQLVLARDRLGIKPLYVYEGPEGLVFGSELKAILRFGGPWRLDLLALLQYLSFGYVPGPRTIVRNIRKLRSAEILTYAAGRSRSSQYWSLPTEVDVTIAEPEAAARLWDLLQDAVRSHLVSDVALGAFLSGGIDSSTIVGLMARFHSGPVRTFSIGFSDGSKEDAEYARAVAGHFGTDHHELVVCPEDVVLIEALPTVFDEPFADSAAIPNYLLARMTRQHVTVALSGEGADEILGGYSRYRVHYVEDYLRRLVPRTLMPVLRWGLAVADPASKGWNLADRLLTPMEIAFVKRVKMENTSLLRRLCAPELLSAMSEDGGEESIRRMGSQRHADRFNRLLAFDTETFLVDDILTKADRTSMAHGLEVRVPFLDHAIVEFVFSVPFAYKVRRGSNKHVFRLGAEKLLPPAVMARPKEGLDLPLGRWLRGPLRSIVEETLMDAGAECGLLFDTAEVRKLMADHMSGRRNRAGLLWALFVFHRWAAATPTPLLW